jgi:hypothetical protein
MTHEFPQHIIMLAARRPAAGGALTPIGRAGVKPVALLQYDVAFSGKEANICAGGESCNFTEILVISIS